MAAYQYVYHMQGVSKTYPGGKKCFENIHLSFLPGVKIGVVGVNGAGKSTTFGMLTGDLSITSGKCFVNGFDLSSKKSKAQSSVGYCPQFDALIDCMTGRETLNMFCKLRGLGKNDTQKSIENLYYTPLPLIRKVVSPPDSGFFLFLIRF